VLLVADYDRVRKKGLSGKHVRSVPMQEVHFPEEVTFPYAVARDLAIKNMTEAVEPLPAPPPPLPLPFAVEAGEPDVPDVVDVNTVVPQAPRFKITLSRILRYDTTPGCRACEEMSMTRPHTPECRERFRTLMEKRWGNPHCTKSTRRRRTVRRSSGSTTEFLCY